MTGPQPRANVAAIPAYVAGKPPTVRPGMTSYKLSSNENPYPPLPGVVEAAHRAVDVMNRYPDMGNSALYDALAARLRRAGRATSRLATGSVALIYQLVRRSASPVTRSCYAWRSFEAYPIAVTAAAATSVQVPVTADGRHDLDAMARARHRPRPGASWSARPTTRPARRSRQAELDAFLARVPERRARGGRRGLRRVRADGRPGRRDRDRTAHVRTSWSSAPSPRPTGWPGSGSGTPSAQEPVAAALRAVSLPFGVSGVAQAAAIASLDGRARAPRAGRRAGRRAGPGAVGAWPTPAGRSPRHRATSSGSTLGERTADFAAAADELGIVVRPFAGEGARVSIGEPEANDRLLELARSFSH